MPGLTDEQIAQLEAQQQQQQPKKGLTDEEMSALEAQHGGSNAAPQGDSFMGKLKQAFLGGKMKDENGRDVTPIGDDLGAAALALPIESAPAGLAKLAEYLGGSGVLPAMSRIGANAAVGAAQGAPSGNATSGAVAGAVGGSLGEGLGALAGVGKSIGAKFARMNPAQAEAYINNPAAVKEMAGMLEDPLRTPELQDQAASAIQNSRKALRGQGLQNAASLSDLLKDKSVMLDPSDYSGIDPRIDELLSKAKGSVTQGPEEAFKSMASRGPKPIPVDANDANTIKRILQEKSNFAGGTVLDPVQAAKNAELASKAQGLRSSLEQVGGDGVSDLNKTMQEGTLLNSSLRKGLKNPLSFVSTEAPDRVATLARAENNGAGGLLDFGNQLGAAKTMTAKDVGSGVPTFPAKFLGRLGLRASDAAQDAAEASPVATQRLIRSLFSDEGNQK